MSNFFFTVVDKNFVLRALALYKSFEKFNKKELFFIVSLDDESNQIVRKFSTKKLISINIRDFDQNLLKKIKNSRNYREFCWTIKSVSFCYIFKKYKYVKWVFYIDSDSMVLSSFRKAINNNFDAILTPHRPINQFFKMIIKNVGNYNAGFLGLKNNYNGKKILDYWKTKCIESCTDHPKEGKYGDQIYLSDIVQKFKKINNDPHKGLNVAPWNLCDDNNIINSKNLPKDIIFVHFQGFKILNMHIFNLYSDNFKVSKITFQKIYLPYIKLLKETFAEIKKKEKKFEQKIELNINLKLVLKKLFYNLGNLKLIYSNEK